MLLFVDFYSMSDSRSLFYYILGNASSSIHTVLKCCTIRFLIVLLSASSSLCFFLYLYKHQNSWLEYSEK
uniref:SHRI protein 2 n=1 Tax=Chiloscyllium plagiosum TaxID=36176 RepID=Q6J5J0_9CHON|nr:sHRI protein 2 [Chiloscyllium plagiosum]